MDTTKIMVVEEGAGTDVPVITEGALMTTGIRKLAAVARVTGLTDTAVRGPPHPLALGHPHLLVVTVMIQAEAGALAVVILGTGRMLAVQGTARPVMPVPAAGPLHLLMIANHQPVKGVVCLRSDGVGL